MAEGEEQAQQVEKKGLTDAQLLERVYANESVRIEAMSNHTDTYREMRPEDAIARHGSLDDWSSYVDMLSGDAADSTTVLNLCRDEAWEAAYGRWSCMDTSPRDRFTEPFFAVLFGRNETGPGNQGVVDRTLSVNALLVNALQYHQSHKSFFSENNIAQLVQVLHE